MLLSGVIQPSAPRDAALSSISADVNPRVPGPLGAVGGARYPPRTLRVRPAVGAMRVRVMDVSSASVPRPVESMVLPAAAVGRFHRRRVQAPSLVGSAGGRRG